MADEKISLEPIEGNPEPKPKPEVKEVSEPKPTPKVEVDNKQLALDKIALIKGFIFKINTGDYKKILKELRILEGIVKKL